MKANSRLVIATALVLALAPGAARGQESPSNTVSNEVVGPPELQDFSLPGTRRPPADTQTPAAPAQAPTPTRATPGNGTAAPPRTISAPPASSTRKPLRAPSREPAGSVVAPSPDAAVTLSPSLPRFVPGPPITRPPPSSAEPRPAPVPQTWGVLPWLVFALLLGGFGWWVLRRRRSLAVAGDAEAQSVAETQSVVEAAPRSPAPQLQAAPPTAPPRTPTPRGIISTRLRPWIDVGILPLRCVLDPEQFMLEVQLEIMNSGSSPARSLLAEAVLIPGGADQDRQIEAFFNRPAVAGGRLESLGPLDQTAVRNQLIANHDQLQAVEVGGRQVIIPVVALDVRYQWSGGEGQTSIAWLVSRDTGAERLAPIPMSPMPRVYRTLGSRALPLTIRR